MHQHRVDDNKIVDANSLLCKLFIMPIVSISFTEVAMLTDADCGKVAVLPSGEVCMLWGLRDAATYLGVCSATLRKLAVAENRIPYVRIGRQIRFQPAQLQRWLDSQTRVTTDQTDRV